MKSRLKEIIGRLAESWFSILFALLPALLIALGAVLIHFRTNIAYRLLQSDSAIHGIRYFRIGLFVACIVGLTIAVAVLRKKKPELGKKPFTLYILVPFAGLFIYLSWTPTLLISLFIIILLTLSQLPLLRDIISASERKSRVFHFLLAMQAATLFMLLIFGIMLWVHVRDRSYRNAQWLEIKNKGLYAEFTNLNELAQNPRIEFALIRDPAMRFYQNTTQRFGKGDDAYSSTYALLGNDDDASADVSRWPLWFYCGAYSCSEQIPLLVTVDLCPDPKDCHEDFATILRQAGVTKFPANLRLLSPAAELAWGEKDWSKKINVARVGILIMQVSYFLIYALLATLNRLLKKPADKH